MTTSHSIKFRAWSIKKRKYIDIDTLYCVNGKVCGIVSDGVVYDTDDVVLEQDTGLKDKNGERICEGDIVKQAHSSLVYPVKFEYGGFLPFTSDIMSFDNDYCEVIGNIHENPELLEVKNE